MIRGAFEYQIIANIIGAWVTLNGGKIVSHGIELNVNNPQVTNSVKYHLFTQKYEEQELNLIAKYVHLHMLLHPDMDVVEFGGGLGFISCVIGKKINPLNKHIVVEPNPSISRLLNSNRILNDCRFEILNKAYSSSLETVDLDISGPFESGHITTASKTTVAVPTINIEGMVRKYGLNQFCLIVDVEGKEFDLIQDEFKIISTHCPMVLIEFHDKFGSMSSVLSKFESEGYRTFQEENVCVFEKVE